MEFRIVPVTPEPARPIDEDEAAILVAEGLAEECGWCEGSGIKGDGWARQGEARYCHACGGFGYLFTQKGYAVHIAARVCLPKGERTDG